MATLPAKLTQILNDLRSGKGLTINQVSGIYKVTTKNPGVHGRTIFAFTVAPFMRYSDGTPQPIGGGRSVAGLQFFQSDIADLSSFLGAVQNHSNVASIEGPFSSVSGGGMITAGGLPPVYLIAYPNPQQGSALKLLNAGAQVPFRIYAFGNQGAIQFAEVKTATGGASQFVKAQEAHYNRSTAPALYKTRTEVPKTGSGTVTPPKIQPPVVEDRKAIIRQLFDAVLRRDKAVAKGLLKKLGIAA